MGDDGGVLCARYLTKVYATALENIARGTTWYWWHRESDMNIPRFTP
jgi:hypothetical protein